MSTQTAKFILNRHGLLCFSPGELRGLLDDRFMPLPNDVKTAIRTLLSPKTLLNPERQQYHARPYRYA